MQKIALLTYSKAEAQHLMRLIEGFSPYQMYQTETSQGLRELLQKKVAQLVVVGCQRFGQDEFQLVRDIRTQGFVYPILILSDSLDYEQFHVTHEKFRTHFLDRPYENKAFLGITRKLLVSRQMPQQKHKRFRTVQSAVVESFITGELQPTKMLNLSQGGAYFESQNKPSYGVGDLLRMKLSLDDMDREYQVSGRVVWTTKTGHVTGAYGVGVKFIKKADIYRQLMDKV